MSVTQIVVKTAEATKQTKDQNDNKKQTNKQNKTTTTKRAEGAGVEKQLNKWLSDVIIIDLRETERGKGLKCVLLRLYPKQLLADLQIYKRSVWRKKS